ncbi:MAG: endolytic transglycosylase MltG [Treponema sp.]|nr:endolytic transglycosylase MltG [Treponema sp.]
MIIRHIIKMTSLLVGMALLLVVVIAGGLVYCNDPPTQALVVPEEDETLRIETDGTVSLEVRSGESAWSVGRRLEAARIIKTRYFWYFLSRLDKEYIKTGIYRLALPATQVAIHATLVAGRQPLIKVTIPEGVTLKKTARILAESAICTEADFLASATDQEIIAAYQVPGLTMEGYLYPDTYLFPRTYPAAQVVKTMADTFFRRIAELPDSSGDTGSTALDMPPEALFRRVIIASIVEREYRVDEEAALMAGVFYNRLKIGMALQSCATVEYVITEIQGKPHPEVLYTRDTEIQDPYNTYMRTGLPPGPIASPGAVALNAAFNPLPSEYLYFRLVDADAGRHYFSKTLDDHIKAGALYVKRRVP